MKHFALFPVLSQNDQSTGEIKVIGGDDLSTLTGKVGLIQTTRLVCQSVFTKGKICVVGKH